VFTRTVLVREEPADNEIEDEEFETKETTLLSSASK
jgi:hypothetical protein